MKKKKFKFNPRKTCDVFNFLEARRKGWKPKPITKEKQFEGNSDMFEIFGVAFRDFDLRGEKKKKTRQESEEKIAFKQIRAIYQKITKEFRKELSLLRKNKKLYMKRREKELLKEIKKAERGVKEYEKEK